MDLFFYFFILVDEYLIWSILVCQFYTRLEFLVLFDDRLYVVLLNLLEVNL